MKYIVKPGPVKLIDRRTKQPIQEQGPKGLQDMATQTFETYALQFWLSDQRLGMTLAVQRKINKMADKLEKAGPCWILEDDEWNLLKPIIENPQSGYTNPLVGCQVACFGEAFLAATDEQPTEMTVQ